MALNRCHWEDVLTNKNNAKQLDVLLEMSFSSFDIFKWFFICFNLVCFTWFHLALLYIALLHFASLLQSKSLKVPNWINDDHLQKLKWNEGIDEKYSVIIVLTRSLETDLKSHLAWKKKENEIILYKTFTIYFTWITHWTNILHKALSSHNPSVI